MHTHADKTQENKSQSVVNGASQMQSGGEFTFQFVDNRPEAIAQRKLQEMANNGPQAKQLRAFQEMANQGPRPQPQVQNQQPVQKKSEQLPDQKQSGSEVPSGNVLGDIHGHFDPDNPAQCQRNPAAGQALLMGGKVVQRAVNWNNVALRKTAGLNYAISGDNTTLYSKDTAADPQPPGLYIQGTDQTTDTPAVPLKTWRPNVRFLSAQTIDTGNLPITTPASADILAVLSPQFEAIKREVQQAMGRDTLEGETSPTMGIVGRNDCAQWAKTLQGLITQANAATGVGSEAFDLGVGADPNLAGAPGPLRPGDEMEQILGAGAGSEHHGATVVANDGTSIVTLEAHVEQNLDAPAFHIYEGLPGFVNANNRGPEGDNQYLADNGRRGVINRVENAFQSKNNRNEMLAYYSADLNSSDNDAKLAAIQGVLRYYQSVAAAPPDQSRCFLTTACTNSRGLPDDCEELTVLRSFRDGYMLSVPEGPKLIQLYYKIAPGIVTAINHHHRRDEIYDEIYGIIRSCVSAIKNGEYAFAMATYKSMVAKLSQQYGEHRREHRGRFSRKEPPWPPEAKTRGRSFPAYPAHKSGFSRQSA